MVRDWGKVELLKVFLRAHLQSPHQPEVVGRNSRPSLEILLDEHTTAASSRSEITILCRTSTNSDGWFYRVLGEGLQYNSAGSVSFERMT